MDSTPASLLERVCRSGDQEAWARFVELYTPLICYWARRAGLQESDAADLTQDVLLLLLHKLPEFRYEPHRSFRSWLETVTLNKWRERMRRRSLPMEDDPAGVKVAAAPNSVADFWETEYRRHLAAQAFHLMQRDFQPATWKACWEVVAAGRPAAEVAQELGMSVGAVYAAKCRVLRRLRAELAGLLD